MKMIDRYRLIDGMMPKLTQQQWFHHFTKLEALYLSPGRHYHTLAHVEQVLEHLDDMQLASNDSSVQQLDKGMWDLIRLAAWYHDAHQGPRAEIRSYHEFLELADEGKLDGASKHLVVDLIKSTDHKRIPLTLAEAYLCDADLAILGASEDEFDRYELQIRAEWEHVPLELFCRARTEVLNHFRRRAHIYSTEYGVKRWEARALQNLDRSRSRLALDPSDNFYRGVTSAPADDAGGPMAVYCRTHRAGQDHSLCIGRGDEASVVLRGYEDWASLPREIRGPLCLVVWGKNAGSALLTREFQIIDGNTGKVIDEVTVAAE